MAINQVTGGLPAGAAEASALLNGAVGLAAKGQLTPEMKADVERVLNKLISQSSSSAAGVGMAINTATAGVAVQGYARDTGRHIRPDATLDLAGIKNDNTASPEARKAASHLLDSGNVVGRSGAVGVGTAANTATAGEAVQGYARDTGRHIRPDATLDLAGIKNDYTAPLAARKAASDLLDAGATVSTGAATSVKPAKTDSKVETKPTADGPAAIVTPMQTVKLKSAETVLVKPADATGNAAAAKAAMNANLDKLADHMSGSSDLSKEDFQKIADGTYGSLDNIGELNTADRQKLKAGAKHITENFDKFDVAYEGKDANSRVSALDIRGFTDPKKTVDGINASNTLLGKDTSVPDDKKAVVKENLSALANHLSGNSNSSLEDFQKIAAGVFSPLDHDIRVENADEAKIMAGAKYVTENFDNFDTAQLGRQSNSGVSPDNIRGYTDTNVKDFDDEDQTGDEGAISS